MSHANTDIVDGSVNFIVGTLAKKYLCSFHDHDLKHLIFPNNLPQRRPPPPPPTKKNE